jgi:hypothetical protein
VDLTLAFQSRLVYTGLECNLSTVNLTLAAHSRLVYTGLQCDLRLDTWHTVQTCVHRVTVWPQTWHLTHSPDWCTPGYSVTSDLTLDTQSRLVYTRLQCDLRLDTWHTVQTGVHPVTVWPQTWLLTHSPGWCTLGYSVTFWRLNMKVWNQVAYFNNEVNYFCRFLVVSHWFDWTCPLTDVRLGYFPAFTNPSPIPRRSVSPVTRE